MKRRGKSKNTNVITRWWGVEYVRTTKLVVIKGSEETIKMTTEDIGEKVCSQRILDSL